MNGDQAYNPYDEGVDLESRLEGAIEDFEAERRRSWSDERGRETDFLFLVDGIANQILRASKLLVEPGSNEDFPAQWEGHEAVSEHPAFRREISERIQIALAREFSLGTEQKTERCRELTASLIKSPPSSRVLTYLHRVTRCYIVGFYAECIILCRAVVESAVKDAYRSTRIRKPSIPKGRSKFKALVDHLAAPHVALLSTQLALDAKTIWKEGSDLAHADRKEKSTPSQDEAFRTVSNTVAILQALYDRKRSG